jgi:hypothetical protein
MNADRATHPGEERADGRDAADRADKEAFERKKSRSAEGDRRSHRAVTKIQSLSTALARHNITLTVPAR